MPKPVFRPIESSIVRDELQANTYEGAEPSPRLHTPHYNSAQLLDAAFFGKLIALLCACSLGVGSHYAQYTLPPISARIAKELGASNTEFSLLISASGLCSTWTPFIGGMLASRFGTTITSIYATSIILLGQALLLIGDLAGDLRIMALGMFIFGLGISPLSVCIESIIFRFFRNDRHLGVVMAIGLVAGKSASFIAAWTSFPLSEAHGRHAPLIIATALSLFSVLINIFYVWMSKWLALRAEIELESSENGTDLRTTGRVDHKAMNHKRVRFTELLRLDNRFWTYVGFNVFCGTLYMPFPNLATQIFKRRYSMSDAASSADASYLLAGNVVLYPVCGYLIDRYRAKNPNITTQLFMLSSALQLCCFIWLVAPVNLTNSPLPGAISFSFGLGFAPLLLVVIVPQLVSTKYISTTLGAHKSLEYSGSIIFQTLAGVVLDIHHEARDWQIEALLIAFLLCNVIHLIWVVHLWRLIRSRNSDLSRGDLDQREYERVPDEPENMHDSMELMESSQSLLDPQEGDRYPDSPQRTDCAVFSGFIVLLAWVIFLVTAGMRLRSHTRGHG